MLTPQEKKLRELISKSYYDKNDEYKGFMVYKWMNEFYQWEKKLFEDNFRKFLFMDPFLPFWECITGSDKEVILFHINMMEFKKIVLNPLLYGMAEE